MGRIGSRAEFINKRGERYRFVGKGIVIGWYEFFHWNSKGRLVDYESEVTVGWAEAKMLELESRGFLEPERLELPADVAWQFAMLGIVALVVLIVISLSGVLGAFVEELRGGR